MKYVLLISTLNIGIQCVTSGQNKWSKSDRNILYDNCISIVSKNKELTKEQSESVCLCYIDEVSNKYSSEDYQTKIDIEVKRIQEATIAQCAKNIGIESNFIDETNTTDIIITKENIKGHWKDDQCEFWLNDDNTYTMKYMDGKSSRGTWNISNNQLNLFQKGILSKREREYTIIDWSKNKFIYQSDSRKSKAQKAIRVN